MSVGSRVASEIWAGALLCVLAPAGFAEPPLGLRAPGGFVVEKVSTVPPMSVRAMVQTRDGYLWLGSYGGLFRFDGLRLVTFNVANTPGLSSDSIHVLLEDRSANLWVGTDDAGLMRYRAGEFYRVGPEQGLTETEVRSICEDHEGTIWVGTRRGLFFLKDDRQAAKAKASVLDDATIETLGVAPNGRLWIGASKGLLVGGSLDLQSTPGRGTRLTVLCKVTLPT